MVFAVRASTVLDFDSLAFFGWKETNGFGDTIGMHAIALPKRPNWA